jgi:FkbM family methyltransferase
MMHTVKKLAVAAVPMRFQTPARYWYRFARGRLEREMAVFLEHARPGTVAVDIGTNSGIYAYAMARHGATVHAFEPQPYYASIIRAIRGVIVHECALSDHEGTGRLAVPVRHGAANSGGATVRQIGVEHESVPITLSALDTFDLRNVSAIKIDVEGHELAVLRGARETLERERPILLIEIEERHTLRPVMETVDVLADMGYEATFRDAQGVWQPASRFDAARHQSSTPGDSSYINNFLFVPR